MYLKALGASNMKSNTLQSKIKKRRPFDSLEQEVMLNLFHTADGLFLQFERLFRAHDLTFQQYNVLRILRGEGEPLSCLEISNRLITAVPALTSLLDRLETAERVVRKRSQEDRRVIYVGITKRGLKILTELDRPVMDLHRRLLGHLSNSELKEMNRVLVKARTQDPQGDALE